MHVKGSYLQLFKCVFQFDANIELKRIKYDEYKCRTIDEPFHDLVEGIPTLLLPAILNDTRCVNKCDLFQQLS